MARYVFKLPDVGEGVAESEIAAWRVAVGETVQEDQPLVDMLTDKAAVEIPSPVAGVIVQCNGEVGDKIAVGASLLVIEIESLDEAPGEPPPPAIADEPEFADLPVTPPIIPRAASPMASPAVRRRARERGIDLAMLTGSGPRGRITQADLDACVENPVSVPLAPREGVEQIRVIGLRRKIAEAMLRSWQRIPHITYVEETDVTELEALRTHFNANKRADQPKLTLLPFLILALVRVLPRNPQVNATYDDEAGMLYRHAALHLGIATQTPNGLIVPVIHNAQTLDLWQLANEIRRLSTAARDGKAKREELSGSTLTITSLGPLGGVVTTPIINAPEVAIFGINRIVERPTIRGGHVVPRLMMNLSSSFDHRIVDGWEAAQFIQQIKAVVEHPAILFMP